MACSIKVSEEIKYRIVYFLRNMVPLTDKMCLSRGSEGRASSTFRLKYNEDNLDYYLEDEDVMVMSYETMDIWTDIGRYVIASDVIKQAPVNRWDLISL